MNNHKNKLEQLKSMTVVVCDTGDINSIKKYAPTDATTNPSLILAAVKDPQYSHLIEEAVEYSKKQLHPSPTTLMMDKLFVNFGAEILKLIPGRVSTEVDARLSFDVEGSIQKAQALIRLYEKMGVDRSRVLIKLASTWEGAIAAKQLETMGIHCNMTLIFSLVQAIHCAEAGVTLISPFVGRILDWFKKNEGVTEYAPAEDPGVRCVTQTYNYFKKFEYKTQVMGASFRNAEEILELAGCDLLTISPKFLEELQQTQGDVVRKLNPTQAVEMEIAPIYLNEKTFRLMLNEDAMATEKLAEGIRTFAKDAKILEKTVCEKYKL